MFGVGWPELVLIAIVVAILLIGLALVARVGRGR